MRALLVEEGFQRAALTACRALAAVGWDVGTASPAYGFAAASRHAAGWHETPWPSLDGGYGESVAAAVRAGRYDVVLPVGDPELVAVSAGRDGLGAAVALPPHGTVLTAIDKVALAATAAEVGVAVPPTVALGDLVPAGAGPFVVKPRTTAAVDERGELLRHHAAWAPDAAAALAAAERFQDLGAEAVVQPFVGGRLGALVLVLDREGRTVARAQQLAQPLDHRLEVSVHAVTVPVDEELAARGVALLRALGWWGVAQLQFVFPPGGEPLLIDLNGRLYGSLALTVAAGVNVPALLAELAVGRTPGPVADARPGVRYHWLEADLRRARSPLAALRALARAPGAVHALWSRDDPRPALAHVSRLAGRAARRLYRRKRAARRAAPATGR